MADPITPSSRVIMRKISAEGTCSKMWIKNHGEF
jgi:hypothetical protein